MNNNTIQPKVSVCVVTYNQENFIGQCLESLVTQETNFPFEIIVSDDCSADTTPQIIQEYANKYPDIIKPVLHKTNMGALKNFVYTHKIASAKYVAHMDGDDYALPGKLQAQANFLDANPNCNIVWHRVKVINPVTNNMQDDLIEFDKLPKEGFSRAEILQFISIGMNSTKMYRAKQDIDLPDFDVVDYFMNVEEVGEGKACFVSNEIYGVYRSGIGIASSGMGTRIILCKSFLYFAQKYPQYKDRISAAALLYFVVDIKNRRASAKLFFRTWIKVFHIKSFYLIYKNWYLTKMTKLPQVSEHNNV